MSQNQQISEEQLAQFKESFDMFDMNRDGSIELKEMAKAIRALGVNPSNKALRELIKEVDDDKNGKLEFDDFVRLMGHISLPKTKEEQEEDIEGAFKIFDKDNSGYIEKDELVRVVTTLGEPLSDDEVQAMLDCADSDKDGKINYKEFVKFMTKPVLSSTMGQ